MTTTILLCGAALAGVVTVGAVAGSLMMARAACRDEEARGMIPVFADLDCGIARASAEMAGRSRRISAADDLRRALGRDAA